MKHWIFLFALLTVLGCRYTESTTHSFTIHRAMPNLSIPMSLDLKEEISSELDMVNYSLFAEIENKERKLISMQFDSLTRLIWFMHVPGSQTYWLTSEKLPTNTNIRINATKVNGDLQLSIDNRSMLSYRYGMTYPPKGIDSVFKKSGYVHPLRSPKGDTLSRIQPPDHYHHYGIWGPWTHVQINGKQVDFWNIGDKKGTVLFKEFKDIQSGSVYSSLKATQEHIDYITKEDPQIALNEELELKLWNLNRPDRYMFDYTSSFSTPLKEGLLFEAYRYGGGIGMRFTERWTKDNSTVLTSEGEDRLTADGTTAKWCIVKGNSVDGKGTNGILFMSNPKNQAHPEPMRVWPIDANGGRGDLFFEFCPIRYKEWPIHPNATYQLKYRMVVFEGDLTAEEAEGYWQAFANPVVLP